MAVAGAGFATATETVGFATAATDTVGFATATTDTAGFATAATDTAGFATAATATAGLADIGVAVAVAVGGGCHEPPMLGLQSLERLEQGLNGRRGVIQLQRKISPTASDSATFLRGSCRRILTFQGDLGIRMYRYILVARRPDVPHCMPTGCGGCTRPRSLLATEEPKASDTQRPLNQGWSH